MDYKPYWHWDGTQLRDLNRYREDRPMITDDEWDKALKQGIYGDRSVVGSTAPCEGVSEGSNPSDHPNLLSAGSEPQAGGALVMNLIWSAIQDGKVITSNMSDQQVYEMCNKFATEPIVLALENFLTLEKISEIVLDKQKHPW